MQSSSAITRAALQRLRKLPLAHLGVLDKFSQSQSPHCAKLNSLRNRRDLPHWSSILSNNVIALETCKAEIAFDRLRTSFVQLNASVSTVAAIDHLSAIKKLREKSGAPMKDVKSVLVSTDWDLDAAFVELRKKGLAAASKKKSRAATDGLLGLASGEGKTAVVEINSETDFVARNEIFQHLVQRVAAAALQLKSNNLQISKEDLENAEVTLHHPQLEGTRLVRDALAEVTAITGENIQLRRAFLFAETPGVLGTYLHTSPLPGLARMAGFVRLQVEEGSPPTEKLQSLGNNIAMHLVASKPLYLNRASVPEEVLAKERDILTTQAAGSGKPAAVIEKMVEGRLRKFYEEFVLLEQAYILEEGKKVKAAIDSEAKAMGTKVEAVEMLRLEIGEGLERIEKDFASEVFVQALQGAPVVTD